MTRWRRSAAPVNPAWPRRRCHAIVWRDASRRYVEKLATPDVTIADLIGDVDPIKAAKSGFELGDAGTCIMGCCRERTAAFSPSTNCRISGQQGAGRLVQHPSRGDVQIKGYPVRLPLDVMQMLLGDPEDYRARKDHTPLKDRIGSEVRYPRTRGDAISITTQEAWTNRTSGVGSFGRRADQGAGLYRSGRGNRVSGEAGLEVDRRSGVGQALSITALENVVSNAGGAPRFVPSPS